MWSTSTASIPSSLQSVLTYFAPVEARQLFLLALVLVLATMVTAATIVNLLMARLAQTSRIVLAMARHLAVVRIVSATAKLRT